VFLHEGLGSVAAWREFPRQLCDRLDAPGLVYSRRGYGRSAAEPGPRAVDYLHREAHQVLPALLTALDLRAPLLIGHSDGGSIALLAAAHAPLQSTSHAPAAVALMAPHVLVEDVTRAGVRAARIAWQLGGPEGKLATLLAQSHDDPQAAFLRWNDAWLDDAFAGWNIEREIEAIACPVLAIQGHDDAYGTMAQIDRIARRVSGPCRLLKLDRCGHVPHRDQPEAVIAAIGALYRACDAAASADSAR
jgi:pimeloyl-ACP methyl ester carboxylesterase